MQLERLDSGDGARVDAVVDLLEAAHNADFPDDPIFSPSWERGRLLHPVPGSEYEWWLAIDGNAVEAVLVLELPQLDNVTTATAEVTVHPRARRRGHGTALAQQARVRAAAAGRKLIITWCRLDDATEAFLQHNGYSVGLKEHRQLLVVTPERQASWAAMRGEVEPHAAGYTVVQWRDRMPDEHADGLAYLTYRMSTDAPMDELEWEAEAWDAERMRAHDRTMAAWGRRIYTTAVVHEASGQMAGYTTLAYAKEDPTHAWQWNTIVDGEHRGHRLGTLLKVANHAFAFEHEPATRTVFTYNAESNRHMNAINTALGFAPIDRWAESQLRLA